MNEDLIKQAVASMAAGTKFHARVVGGDAGAEKPVGDVIPCQVIKVITLIDWPMVLAHVGNTQEVTMLHPSSDDIQGATVVTMIGVGPSDAALDYNYPSEMLSDEWAGTLFVVLD